MECKKIIINDANTTAFHLNPHISEMQRRGQGPSICRAPSIPPHHPRGYNSSTNHGEQQNSTENVVGTRRKLSSKNTASVQHTIYTYHY